MLRMWTEIEMMAITVEPISQSAARLIGFAHKRVSNHTQTAQDKEKETEWEVVH